MLKCQKPKNIQSLNSILLVLIKKRVQSFHSCVRLLPLYHQSDFRTHNGQSWMSHHRCCFSSQCSHFACPLCSTHHLWEGCNILPPPQNKRMEQDQVKPGHRDSKYSCSFGQGQDRANEQMRAGTSWADLCDCGIVATEPKSVTLLLGFSKMGQAPYTARYTCMQIGQAPYAATSSWGENQ